MKNTILPLCAALMLAAAAAHAGDDPLLGTWKADLKLGGDLKSLTTTIMAAPGGYSFNNDMQPPQGVTAAAPAITISVPTEIPKAAIVVRSRRSPTPAACIATSCSTPRARRASICSTLTIRPKGSSTEMHSKRQAS